MKYEIKTYSEEYIDKQYEIGNSILSTWKGTGQTSAETLKQLYTRDGFDPETKLYAFRENEMVGFMTASIKPMKEGETVRRANVEFPLVLDGHNEAAALLFDEMMERLRSKGVQRVQSRACGSWGNTLDWVRDRNYEKKRTLSSFASMDLSSQSIPAIKIAVSEYDEDTDLEPIRRMYLDNNILSEQQLDNQLKFLQENPDRVVGWNIYRSGDEVLGNSIITTYGDGKTATMAGISAFGDDEKEIIASILGKNIENCKQRNFKTLQLFLFGKSLDKKSEYEQLGIVFDDDLILYHRDI